MNQKPAPAASIGIVFAKDGTPRIKEGWIERLDPPAREAVEKLLAKRGFRLNGNNLEDMRHGNPG